MNKSIPFGFGITAILVGLAFLPLTQYQSNAAMEDKDMEGKGEGEMTDKMMKAPVVIEGELTAPSDGKPFGGEEIGDFRIRVKDHNIVRIVADVEIDPSKANVLEGWLVDMQSGYKLSLGQLGETNTLAFTQRIVNPFIYDVLVITEEPAGDTDPNPLTPVGGAQLTKPFGQ